MGNPAKIIIHTYQTIPTRVQAVRWDGSAEACYTIEQWGGFLLVGELYYYADRNVVIPRGSMVVLLNPRPTVEVLSPEAFAARYELVEEA